MKLEAVHKSGKLVRVELEVEQGTIKSVKFTGDFFAYPEEAMEKLEERLRGSKVDPKLIEKVILEFFEKERIEIPMMSPEDFSYVVLKALGFVS